MILLLAITSGLPDLAEHLFTALEQTAPAPLTLGAALQRLTANPNTPDPLRSQGERFDRWLAHHPERKDMELSDLRPWLALIRRFSFT